MSKNIKRNISKSFDLPEDIVMDIPSIKMIGNNEVFIENHKGILEYTSKILRLNSKLGDIKITGNELKIIEISQDEISINGIINSVEFIKYITS